MVNLAENSSFAIALEPLMKRIQPKADSLLELLMFPQGLAVRTIDARVEWTSKSRSSGQKSCTRVKRMNRQTWLNLTARKQCRLRLIELK